MKIVKRIIANLSILALIICVVLGVKKGSFEELFDQLRKNSVASEIIEITTFNAEEVKDSTASVNGQNTIANTPRPVTFDESFFYSLGEDIYFNYLPSLEKGEVIVNIKRASISTELNATTLEYLDDPDYFSRRLAAWPDLFSDGYYLISVDIQFTNIGSAQTSWFMSNCSIRSFDKNGQVDTHKGGGITHSDGKINGNGEFKNGVITLKPGETALCKWTGMLAKRMFDNVKDRNEQIYFAPSDMYFRSWNSSFGPGRLAFVELNLEVN